MNNEPESAPQAEPAQVTGAPYRWTDNEINEAAFQHGLIVEGSWNEDAVAFGRELLASVHPTERSAGAVQRPAGETWGQTERAIDAYLADYAFETDESLHWPGGDELLVIKDAMVGFLSGRPPPTSREPTAEVCQECGGYGATVVSCPRCFPALFAGATRPPAVQRPAGEDRADAERFRWLLQHLNGRDLREAGVIYSEWSAVPQAIDGAMQAERDSLSATARSDDPKQDKGSTK